MTRELMDTIPERAEHAGHRRARAGHPAEPARRRRRAADRADLHGDARQLGAAQHDPARRHAGADQPGRRQPCRTTSTTRSSTKSVYQTSAISAESSAGGVRVNLVPKDGGNSIHGSGFFGGSADSWGLQSDNVDDFLRSRGLASGARIDYLNDFNFAMGGPIAKRQAVVLRIGAPSGHVHPGAEHVQERRRRPASKTPGSTASCCAAPGRRRRATSSRSRISGTTSGRSTRSSSAARKGCRSSPRRRPAIASRGCTTSPRRNGRRRSPAGCCSRPAIRATSFTTSTSTSRAPTQERGTPEWYANTSRLDSVAGGLQYRTRVGQIQQWNSPDQHSTTGVDLVRDGHAQLQDRAAVCVGQQPVDAST